ncbi:MAG: cytochrome c3 family protein [Firmicutes bacterium]|nr:cytochrome c3 family protein [Bacillota bacterium]
MGVRETFLAAVTLTLVLFFGVIAPEAAGAAGPAGAAGVSAAPNTCVDCHNALGGENSRLVGEWKESIHGAKGVACSGCHGGNPAAADMGEAMSQAAGFRGKPGHQEIPAFCARCHADPKLMRQYGIPTDQFAQYQVSVHGRRLAEKQDANVAVCTSCHGTHDIKAKTDPSSSVYRTNVPKTCARCHGNATLMARYGRKSDQYEKYLGSVHGQRLLEAGDAGAPNCADCHGTHGAAPPGVAEVANVCGQCHAQTQEYFNQGAHRLAAARGALKCIACHENHDIKKPSDLLLESDGQGGCQSCHAANSVAGQEARGIARELQALVSLNTQAGEALDKAENANISLPEERARLVANNTALVEARALQHAVSDKKVQDLIQPALATARAVKQAGNEAVGRSRKQHAFLLWMAAILLAIAAVTYARKLSYSSPAAKAATGIGGLSIPVDLSGGEAGKVAVGRTRRGWLAWILNVALIFTAIYFVLSMVTMLAGYNYGISSLVEQLVIALILAVLVGLRLMLFMD